MSFVQTNELGEKLRGTIDEILDFGLKINEFKVQSCYFGQFRTNSFEKGTKP